MIEHVIDNISRLLGLEIIAAPYAGEAALPRLLRELYTFYHCSTGETAFILMCDRRRGELTPKSIVKHAAMVRETAKIPVALAADSMPSYNRNRLIQKQMPFVIPPRQLYLPFLGAAWRANNAHDEKHVDSLSIPAQLLVIAGLNGKIPAPLAIRDAMTLIGYSRISVIRAFDELEHFRLARRDPANKRLTFPADRRSLWRDSRPLLDNPCRKTVGLEHLPANLPIFPAGATALAARSMLNPPDSPEYAVAAGIFNKRQDLTPVPLAAAEVKLQLWNYPPTVIGGDVIDPFSLYLSLKDDPDERMGLALEEMLKGWL
ncbi:MAG: hypothetical protein AB7F32_08295 [Victivallaceae bacterium]